MAIIRKLSPGRVVKNTAPLCMANILIMQSDITSPTSQPTKQICF